MHHKNHCYTIFIIQCQVLSENCYCCHVILTNLPETYCRHKSFIHQSRLRVILLLRTCSIIFICSVVDMRRLNRLNMVKGKAWRKQMSSTGRPTTGQVWLLTECASRLAIRIAKLVRWLQEQVVWVLLVSRSLQPCVDQYPIMLRSE